MKDLKDYIKDKTSDLTKEILKRLGIELYKNGRSLNIEHTLGTIDSLELTWIHYHLLFSGEELLFNTLTVYPKLTELDFDIFKGDLVGSPYFDFMDNIGKLDYKSLIVMYYSV